MAQATQGVPKGYRRRASRAADRRHPVVMRAYAYAGLHFTAAHESRRHVFTEEEGPMPDGASAPASVLAEAERRVPDPGRLARGRLARIRAELARRDCGACVLLDPVNIRYATGARNMQVFMLRNPARYLFLPAEGPVVLFEFPGCHHLAADIEVIDEIRPATTVSFVAAGAHLERAARRWAAEIADLARAHGAGNRRLAIERAQP